MKIMKSWTLSVDEEGLLTFPPEVLEELGWKEGDTLLWEDGKDGSWILTKQVDSNSNKSV
jgi:bifunctional DNA-binding transcriptional regulator/antitoxin component of YhaV-PrlF toxin-antitoxin module